MGKIETTPRGMETSETQNIDWRPHSWNVTRPNIAANKTTPSMQARMPYRVKIRPVLPGAWPAIIKNSPDGRKMTPEKAA